MAYEEEECTHPISPYIITNLSHPPHEVKGGNQFLVSFLGTGGGLPMRERMGPSTLLRIGGDTLVFDVAEGFQRQLMFTRIPLITISKIFITHMHGDHILGLPGLLLELNSAAKLRWEGQRTKIMIDIYGPPGLYEYIVTTLHLTKTKISSGFFVVHELVGSRAEPEARKTENVDSRQQNFNRGLRRPNLHYNRIPRNRDGTWTLTVPTTEFFLDAMGNRMQYTVMAAEVNHVYGVATFGYAVKEQPCQLTLDVEKAKACGVQPGRKYKSLKLGESVLSDDESRTVYPHEVLIKGSSPKPRKFAIAGDNCNLSPAMVQLSQDCDVFVHEATIIGKTTEEAIIRRHSTPAMAGRIAKEVNARVLCLNHISPKSAEYEDMSELVKAAEKENEGISAILLTHDFMEIIVPRNGFDFQNHDTMENSECNESSSIP